MVESIYTIPLTDALDEECNCMFCYLEEKLEQEQIEYALGAAMMEPDFRILSNEKGYCRHHIGMMARAKKALPLALVLDTRCNEVLKNIKNADSLTQKSGFLKKGKPFFKALRDVVNGLAHTCLVCERIEKTMGKFMGTFWYLYGKEPEFREKFLNSKGVCLPHFAKLLNALECVSAAKKELYSKELYDLEIKALKHDNDEVHGFIKQFDYRSDKNDWQVSRDAHLLCAARLSGRFLRE